MGPLQEIYVESHEIDEEGQRDFDFHDTEEAGGNSNEEFQQSELHKNHLIQTL